MTARRAFRGFNVHSFPAAALARCATAAPGNPARSGSDPGRTAPGSGRAIHRDRDRIASETPTPFVASRYLRRASPDRAPRPVRWPVDDPARRELRDGRHAPHDCAPNVNVAADLADAMRRVPTMRVFLAQGPSDAVFRRRPRRQSYGVRSRVAEQLGVRLLCWRAFDVRGKTDPASDIFRCG